MSCPPIPVTAAEVRREAFLWRLAGAFQALMDEARNPCALMGGTALRFQTGLRREAIGYSTTLRSSIPARGLLFAPSLPVRRHPLRDLGPLLRCPLPAPTLRRRLARCRLRGLRLLPSLGLSPSAAPVGRWCPLRGGLPPRARQRAQRPLKGIDIAAHLLEQRLHFGSLGRHALDDDLTDPVCDVLHRRAAYVRAHVVSIDRHALPAGASLIRAGQVNSATPRTGPSAQPSPMPGGSLPERTPTLNGAIRLRHSCTPASAPHWFDCLSLHQVCVRG